MAHRATSGFSLLELTVSVGVLVAVAGVLVIGLGALHDESEQGQAAAEVVALGQSLNLFERDTNRRPTGIDGATSAHVLLGPGDRPDLGSFGSGPVLPLADFLMRGTMLSAGWRGPYAEKLDVDPWGRAYVVNVHGYFLASERVWVLSAGANGIVETDPTAMQVGGDDIGVVVR